MSSELAHFWKKIVKFLSKILRKNWDNYCLNSCVKDCEILVLILVQEFWLRLHTLREIVSNLKKDIFYQQSNSRTLNDDDTYVRNTTHFVGLFVRTYVRTYCIFFTNETSKKGKKNVCIHLQHASKMAMHGRCNVTNNK